MDTRRKFTFCRLCLCKGEVLMDIFQEDERLYTAAEVIIDLLQLQVTEDDGYSKFVCLRCFDKLSEFKQFKEQCMESKDSFEKEFLPLLTFPPPITHDPCATNGQNHVVNERLVKEEPLDREHGIPSGVTMANSEVSHANVKEEEEEEREDIVVEVDVYPQIPLSPVHQVAAVKGSAKEDALLQDLSLPRRVDDHLPNPYLSLKMKRGMKRKSARENSACVPAHRRSRKLTPVRLTDNRHIGDNAKADARLECWQEMLSRTGVDITSCGAHPRVPLEEGRGQSPRPSDLEGDSGSVEYWRRRMQREAERGVVEGGSQRESGAGGCQAPEAVVAKQHQGCEESTNAGGSDEESSRTPPPGGKVHRCDECAKVFTRSSSLFRHRRIHTGEKPFVCAECGKTFTQSGYLMQHMRVHSGDRRFACEECGKMFTDSGNLIQHRRVHTGEKPYGCNVCGMSFTQNGHLARHLKVHSGERPFQCEECGKKFTNCSNLSRHVKLHQEGRV